MSTLIEVVSVINAAAATVFDLELDVDVHAESLAKSRETAKTTSGRRQLGLGDEVTFRARHFGWRWNMTSRITAYSRRDSNRPSLGSFGSARNFGGSHLRTTTCLH